MTKCGRYCGQPLPDCTRHLSCRHGARLIKLYDGGLIAVQRLVFGIIVKEPARDVVDECLRWRALRQNDLMVLRLDVIDDKAFTQFRRRYAPHRGAVDKRTGLHEHVIDQ